MGHPWVSNGKIQIDSAQAHHQNHWDEIKQCLLSVTDSKTRLKKKPRNIKYRGSPFTTIFFSTYLDRIKKLWSPCLSPWLPYWEGPKMKFTVIGGSEEGGSLLIKSFVPRILCWEGTKNEMHAMILGSKVVCPPPDPFLCRFRKKWQITGSRPDVGLAPPSRKF